MTPFELVQEQVQDAMQECQRSIDWYYFRIEPLMERYRTPIDGDFARRRWWFVLREVV